MILRPSYVAAGPATTTFHNAPSSPSPTSLIPGYSPENWSSLIGIITAIVGNVLISFALNMQRYAHIRLEREWREKERQRKRGIALYRDSEADSNGQHAIDRNAAGTEAQPLLSAQSNAGVPQIARRKSTGRSLRDEGASDEAYKQKSYLRSPWWWAGIILMTTGEAGNFLAYGFAPASIVSPLGVVALISNCIIAPILLKERFRKRDGFGVFVAVGGAVTVVLSASDNNPKLGPEDIWDLITTWEFETYFGITVAVMIALMVASNKFGGKSILIDLGLVGLFGGYTALSTKGVASMLSYTLWRALTFRVTYLLVAILGFTAVMQIKYVNRALQRFDATQVIPVQFVLFTLSVILGSAILYRDFERTSGEDAGKFIGGCALTFAGVWLITSGRHQRRDEDEEAREPEGEDAISLYSGERYHDDVDEAGDEGGDLSTRGSSTVRAVSPTIVIDRKLFVPDAAHSPAPTPAQRASHSQQQVPSSTDAHVASSSSAVNPWAPGALESAIVPPAPFKRHSSPVLPTDATMTPTIAPTSTSDLSLAPPRPQTPVRHISDQALPTTPGTGGSLLPRLRRIDTPDRLGARNSLTGHLLASPLSTALSAMAADLKRGGSLRGPPLPTVQRALDFGARRRESVLAVEIDAEAQEEGEPLNRRRTTGSSVEGGVVGSHGENGSRSRSFSGTLGELWRGVKGVKPAAHDEASRDEESNDRDSS